MDYIADSLYLLLYFYVLLKSIYSYRTTCPVSTNVAFLLLNMKCGNEKDD